MSAGNLLRKSGRIVGHTIKLASSIWGWLLIVPIALLVPKRRDYIAVIGKHGGKFIDNGKYFFLQGAPLVAPDMKMVFITDRRDVYRMLADAKPPHVVMFYPSLRSIWFLLRASTAIFETGGWNLKNRGHLLIRARLVQLWHGVGFKKLTKHGAWQKGGTQRGPFTWWANAFFSVLCHLRGVRFNYDVFTSTSTFYERHVFRECMSSRKFLITGYPRNTFGEFPGADQSLVLKNVDSNVATRLNKWQSSGTRIVIVAPTLRTDNSVPLILDRMVLEYLEVFGQEHDVVFLFKFHPSTGGAPEVVTQHVFFIRADSDVYPIMRCASALVTDYSSIYMDYLIADKPVHFFIPDLDKKGSAVGDLQLDFETMTPGPKVIDWEQLCISLLAQWKNDTYKEQRAQLRQLAFDDLSQAESVPKVLDYLEKACLIAVRQKPEGEPQQGPMA